MDIPSLFINYLTQKSPTRLNLSLPCLPSNYQKKIEEENKFIDLLRTIAGNNSFVTDFWKSDATDIRPVSLCPLHNGCSSMDDNLVRYFTLGHLHFPFHNPVGAAAELELVGDQGEDLPVLVLLTSRASAQAHLDWIKWLF